MRFKKKKAVCRIASLTLGFAFLLGCGGGMTVFGLDDEKEEITALTSEIEGMELGGYVGENLENNVISWQIGAYESNSNIVRQIEMANSGILTLDSILGTDFFGMDQIYNIDIQDCTNMLTEEYFDAVLSYSPRKVNAYFGDAGYRLDKEILPGVTDWTGAEEIWLYVDARNSGAENVKVRLNFEEGDYADGSPNGINEAYTLVRDSKVKLIDGETGEVSETSVVLDSALNDNFVVLEKQFHGFVCFPLDLEHFWRYFESAGGAGNGILDLKDVHQLTLAVGGSDDAAVGTDIYFAFGIIGAREDGKEVPFGLNAGKRFVNVLPFTTDVFIPNITDGAWCGDLYADWDVIVTRGQKSRSGNALGWTMKKTGEYKDRDIRFSNDPNAVTDWTGAKELWVYVDASEVPAETGVRFAFEENTVGRASYSLKDGASVQLRKNGENASQVRTVSADGAGFVTLPARFAGYVCMPLNEQTFYRYFNENDNNVLDLNKVVQFQLSVRGSDAMVGKTVYMDSFAIVGDVGGESLPVATEPATSDTYKEVWTLEDLAPRTGASGTSGLAWYGEFAGKLLTGMAYSYKATQNAQLKEAADKLVSDLAAAQGEDGYLGVFTGGARFSLESGNWDLWNHYHCIVGLLEWHKITGNQTALDTAKKAIDCIYEVFHDRSYLVAGGFETNRGIAHGYAMMYQATGEKKYLDEAERIIMQDCQDEYGWYKTALRDGNYYQSSSARWEVLHMIMTLGILFEETGNEEYFYVMDQIWHNILKTDIHNTGGFTTNEGACGDPYRVGVIETCCTIAWMAFSNEYYKYSKTVEVADELERSYYNGMLGSLLDDDKYCTYNSPMNGVTGTAGGYDGRKVPSQQDISFQYNAGSPDFNCCQANLARGLGQIAEWAAVTDGDELYLNYYGESNIRTQVASVGVNLIQTTEYPVKGAVKIEVGGLAEGTQFTLHLRIPGWAFGTKVRLNGQAQYGVEAGEYYSITRTWENGDIIELDLAMDVRYWSGEASMDGFSSIYYGPVLLTLDKAFAPMYNQNTKFTAEALENAVVSDGSSFGAMLVLSVEVGGTQVALVDYASAGKYNGESTPSTYWSWLKVDGAPSSETLGDRPIWQNTDKKEVYFGEYIDFDRAMYNEGETVTFRVEAPQGYEADTVTVSGDIQAVSENGLYSFTMPASTVRVNVTLKETEGSGPSDGGDGPQDGGNTDTDNEPAAGGCSGAVGISCASVAAVALGGSIALASKKRNKKH